MARDYQLYDYILERFREDKMNKLEKLFSVAKSNIKKCKSNSSKKNRTYPRPKYKNSKAVLFNHRKIHHRLQKKIISAAEEIDQLDINEWTEKYDI